MATLRLFASIREIAGTGSLEVDADNVSDVMLVLVHNSERILRR